ncbi:glucosylceramide transporter ABCA12 isoform 2-T2 [Pholidichthys leucotaenia]
MASFHQLKLLLWKNGLAVIRQPTWSLTLITWPLIIFIIIAVTRHQFPPIVKDTCYVGPRNLPSTGLFPFLQTLMCTTDSNCHNKSWVVHHESARSSRTKRSVHPSTKPKSLLREIEDLLDTANNSTSGNYTEIMQFLDKFGSSFYGNSNQRDLKKAFNDTLHEDEGKTLGSGNMKRVICEMFGPMMSKASPNAFTHGFHTFCSTSCSVFKAALLTLSQVLIDGLLTEPEEIMNVAGMAVTLFHRLQNDTLLLESLLALPHLFSGSNPSADKVLSDTEALLTSIQGAMHFLQSYFPETGASISMLQPLLMGGVKVVRYAQHWPGKNVTILLRDVVDQDDIELPDKMPGLDVDRILDTEIPLDKAVGLFLDKGMMYASICDNSNHTAWACNRSVVHEVLSAIKPDKLSEQLALAYLNHVFESDLSFAMGLWHGLSGILSPGGHRDTSSKRDRRSVDTLPHNTDEHLFLSVGGAVLKIVKLMPELDYVVRTVLNTGCQVMKLTSLSIDTVTETFHEILNVADQVKMFSHMLTTNHNETKFHLDRLLDSVLEIIWKTTSHEPVACRELLSPLVWLLSNTSIEIETVEALICQNSSHFSPQILQEVWMPVIEKALDVVDALLGQAKFNATLPMILSEWDELYNTSLQFTSVLKRLGTSTSEEYWTSWIPDDTAHVVPETLYKSAVWLMVNFGERIEKDPLWPKAKNYFHMIYWILNYRPSNTSTPDCFVGNDSLIICSDTGFEWQTFAEAVVQTFQSPSDALVKILNETKTIQHFLDKDSDTHSVVSLLIDIIQFILDICQGDMSFWKSFQNGSLESLPQLYRQARLLVVKLLSIMGYSQPTVPPVEYFTDLVAVLKPVITGNADQDMWDKFQQVLEKLLSILEGRTHWNSLAAAISGFEKVVKSLVNNMNAEDDLIQSLLTATETLIQEAAASIDGTHFNMSDFTERLQHAIERTMAEAQQANGTFECSETLEIWETVREAAGLSHDAMDAWCNDHLRPVLEAYSESQTVYSHLNMSHMGVGPLSGKHAASAVVRAALHLYQASVNRTRVIQSFVMTISHQLSVLANHSLSMETKQFWLQQLQNMQIQNSLSAFKTLTDQLLGVAPSLELYIQPMVCSVKHVLSNSHLLQNHSSSPLVFQQAAVLFFSCANITLNEALSGNISAFGEGPYADMMRELVEFLISMNSNGDSPMLHEILERFLTHNVTVMFVEKLAGYFTWLGINQHDLMELLPETLLQTLNVLGHLYSFLDEIVVGFLKHLGPFGDLFINMLPVLKQFVTTDGLSDVIRHPYGVVPYAMGHHRARREAPMLMKEEKMTAIINLFSMDHSLIWTALNKGFTEEEKLETAHMFFSSQDLHAVLNGATKDMPWSLNASREETIHDTLWKLASLTRPSISEMPLPDILSEAVEIIPDELLFVPEIKQVAKALLAGEAQEILMAIKNTSNIIWMLFQEHLTHAEGMELLRQLKSQVRAMESKRSVQVIMKMLSIKPGYLSQNLTEHLEMLVEEVLWNNRTSLEDIVYQTFVGELNDYTVSPDWNAVISQILGFNISSLTSPNTTSSVTVGELLYSEADFVEDAQRHMVLDSDTLQLLLNASLPKNNVLILPWLASLCHCSPTASADMNSTDEAIRRTLCITSPGQLFRLSLLLIHHLSIQNILNKMILPVETNTLLQHLLTMAKVATEIVERIDPIIKRIEYFMATIEEMNLENANNQLYQPRRRERSIMSTRTTFVTLSRALCSHGITALLGISRLPPMAESSPAFQDNPKREEMIERFKIPRNASAFCMSMYLDMVNTTGGAIAWAFLKPMLMGKILYTPDTPTTRAIMEKANASLHEFGDIKTYSQSWIDNSDYIMKSVEILKHTLPMLKNSLGNPFVKNFIEMQTVIDVGSMSETLSNFSNMTLMLEKNKNIMNQITTLSTLMVNLSSCIKFDRYRGYDSAEQMDADAQELAKNRDLYASVIFKLPDDEDSSPLPPKVGYTIRMHLDNVMRTDRVRNPYYMKSSHIWPRKTMRYNRGFIYLQENIERAIIEMQTGNKVPDLAVQMQPFPYPCHHWDEYLEAMSFVFPLILMISWVLFVADFVKKLVHERELRLHEYMKMMGVNPVSHFFAWFLECATYLLFTNVLLTLVLKYGRILPHSDAFLIFLYLCTYGLSVLSFCYLVSSFFDKTYVAGLSGSLIYLLGFFPYIIVMAVESNLTFIQKNALSLFFPACFSYASQYATRYEAQGEGIQWSNSYTSPLARDTTSFGWLCWMLVIDSVLYFAIGMYIRMVFPGKYGIPAPWYFPFKLSFWTELCCCVTSRRRQATGLFFANIMNQDVSIFSDDKEGKGALSSKAGEDFSDLPVGVALHGLTKTYGSQVAIDNLNVSFYEGHVTSLLGHNGAGKTTAMSLLTGLFPPTSGSIEVYGRDMQTFIDSVRKDLGVCMQYDVLFDHLTAKEHLLLYGQLKAPHWSQRELQVQVRTILQDTGMYADRHKRVGTLSGGMKRKLSISIAFIGGSRLVVLDEPTTGVDPCSRRSIWDIVIQNKKNRTIIMSTHHLDEAEVLSDRIAFLERGGLKCCGSPFYLKDRLGQGYKLTINRKIQASEQIDSSELKAFIQAHVPEARLKEAQGSDLVYSLPAFSSSNASTYRSLLTALDSNLEDLQLGGYGISDTTLEEVFLQLTHETTQDGAKDGVQTVSENVSDTTSLDSFSSDGSDQTSDFGHKIKFTSSTTVGGMALAWQQMWAILIKRFHHSRRDWKGLIAQILLPVLFVFFAMAMSSIRNDVQHYPELELSPALYNLGPSNSFFSNKNPSSRHLVGTMMSFPGMDNACLKDNHVCATATNQWASRGNSSKPFSECKCTRQEQFCGDNYRPPHTKIPSSQMVYNLSGIDVEKYLVATANDFIRNRYGGFAFGMPLPRDLQLDITGVPDNRTLSKVWFNPEGHHTMPAYLNSLNNIILRSSLPADKDPGKYAISVSSHPYFGRADDEDAILQGILQIIVAMCVLTGFSITTASFAIYEVDEHHKGSKRLQHIAGISEHFYWAVNFLYDMIIYMIPVTLTIGVIAACQSPAFTDRQNLSAVALLLVLFGFSTFPWMYLLAGTFRDSEKAFITYVCINLFASINTILPTSILYFLGEITMNHREVVKQLFHSLSHIFLIFPQFNFGNGLLELARMNIDVQILSGYGVDAYKNPFSTDCLGWMLLSSFIQGVLFFTLRLLLNRSLIRKVSRFFRSKPVQPVSCEGEDEDVVAEQQRVSSGAANSDILQVNQLSKVYQHLSNKVHAVKRLSVGIPAGECFGLLGVNGAGKTTTFKMLTGDTRPTAGTAQIRDCNGRLVDIMECRSQGINIGYCPQDDALDDLLTGEEHLYFYARIRGISKSEIQGVVNYLLKRLHLTYHRNIITDGYSCGTRRKLSTALALVGHPQILLLDEPSSGMDPRTKRHLWKIISEEVKGKCAVVLTSHSMEECEALCGRLAIMVKGQFRCLGSLQHIKNRFGSGFTVKMYLAKDSCDAEAITSFMQRRFPSTYLKDRHSAMVEYHVPYAPGGVADIFDQLESNRNALQIKHFSVSQTTLDEVFINFAMENIGMETTPGHDEYDADSLDSIEAVKT